MTRCKKRFRNFVPQHVKISINDRAIVWSILDKQPNWQVQCHF